MNNLVRGYRSMMDLTQKELSIKLGITPQALSAKENNKRSFKDSEKIYLLDLFKGIDPELSMEKLFFNLKVRKN